MRGQCTTCLHEKVLISDDPCRACSALSERPHWTPRGPAPAAEPAPLAPSMGSWKMSDRPAGEIRTGEDAAVIGRIMRRG